MPREVLACFFPNKGLDALRVFFDRAPFTPERRGERVWVVERVDLLII
jgi:hypothetical protein